MHTLARCVGVGSVVLCTLAACTAEGTRTRPGDGGITTTPAPNDAARPPIMRPDGSPSSCSPGRTDDDVDGDGYSEDQGDCNDCSPQMNPAAFDDATNDVDEDCSGSAATVPEACDEGLALASNDPNDAARAIGLCRFINETERGWGVLSARWTRADGTGMPRDAAQHGLMSRFGSLSTRAGGSMLALSSGAARGPADRGFTSSCDQYAGPFGLFLPPPPPDGALPQGLDPASPACPGVVTGPVYDPVALEVRVRVPSNVEGLQFESNFFTYEYPNYICSPFNDFFVVVMEPRPAGSPDGNIVFDTEGNKVSVNNSLLRACAPGTFAGRRFNCELGTAPLAQTSFDDTAQCGQPGALEEDRGPVGASTGWLRTTVPVEGGSTITLRFTVWDAGDSTLDSLSLIDGFTWLVEDPGNVSTDPIPI